MHLLTSRKAPDDSQRKKDENEKEKLKRICPAAEESKNYLLKLRTHQIQISNATKQETETQRQDTTTYKSSHRHHYNYCKSHFIAIVKASHTRTHL